MATVFAIIRFHDRIFIFAWFGPVIIAVPYTAVSSLKTHGAIIQHHMHGIKVFCFSAAIVYYFVFIGTIESDLRMPTLCLPSVQQDAIAVA